MASQAHDILKEKAKQILLDKGFKETEISYEVKLTKGIRVDVIGKNNEKSIVIECGNVSYYKVEELKNHVDEIICLPYTKEFLEECDDKKRKDRNVCERNTDDIDCKENIDREYVFYPTIFYVGGSLKVTIPKEITERMDLKKGDRVVVKMKIDK